MADALETLYRLRGWTIISIFLGVLGGLTIGYGVRAQFIGDLQFNYK